MPAVSVCAQCGEEFEHKPSRDRKYCSQECWDEARSVNIEKVCKHCGKTYVVHTTQKAEKQQFCSHECSSLFEGEKRKAFEVRTCPNCGEDFEVSPPSLPKKYCSTECYHSHKSSNAQVEHVCGYCGKAFTALQKEGDRPYCSRTCANKARGEGRRETRECARCGKEFVAGLSSTQAFCSRECSNLFGAGYEEADNVPRRRTKVYRKIAERKLGRELAPWEVVHHINMDASDDRESNICVFPDNQQHHLAHGTLNSCVKTLMELDFLRFDGEKYYVPE